MTRQDLTPIGTPFASSDFEHIDTLGEMFKKGVGR
jgi:hypothetical protein